jgi:hypothetical protein
MTWPTVPVVVLMTTEQRAAVARWPRGQVIGRLDLGQSGKRLVAQFNLLLRRSNSRCEQPRVVEVEVCDRSVRHCTCRSSSREQIARSAMIAVKVSNRSTRSSCGRGLTHTMRRVTEHGDAARPYVEGSGGPGSR